MAFDFIKKVFSFGRKQIVEEKPDETAPPPPLNPEALKPAEQPAPPRPQPLEIPREPLTPDVSPAPTPEAESKPREVPQEPAIEPEPQPVPVEVPEKPEPIREEPDEQPAPAPEAEVPAEPSAREAPTPAEEPAPPQPEPVPPAPAPSEIPPSPAPRPKKPELPAPAPQAPKPTAEVPPSPPREAPAPPQVPAEPEPAPTEAPAEAPTRLRSQDEGQPSRDVAPHPSVLPGAGVDPPKKGAGASGKVTVAKRVEQKAEPVAAPTPEPKKSWFQRMREGLSRSSRELSGNIAGVFTKRSLDEDTLQDLEDVLLRADLGMETALRVTDALASGRYGKSVTDEEVRTIMAQEVEKVLTPVAQALELDLSHKPHVILVVGVNGTGKTTTIGKLAAKLAEGGLSVMLAAGDTFRAAAIEQLKIWGERTNSPVVASKLGADAAGLAYDAFEKAKEAGSDVLIIDTAGRLQNKVELMAELEKIVRVLGKLDPEAPHTVLQTVDATTGQNALNQVEIFRNVAGVNGLVMTKLDGTARGGILVAIAARHKLPVYFIGVGEQVEDLEPFSAGEFARAIAGVE